MDLTAYEIQEEVLRRERDWYLSEDGFLDFVRDSGCAPQAQLKPHGEGAHHILKWNGEKDPKSDVTHYKYKMVLWPRGSFKSTVFDIGYCAWLIARNPNIRILVASETGKQGRGFTRQIMEIIDSQWYRDRFGVHRGKHWSVTQGFRSALRTDTHTKEPTLLGTGVGEVRTGMHWDLVVMDDVVSSENCKTEEGIATLWDWFGETLAQLDPGCKLLMIGTLHHYADIYCKILKDPVKRSMFECSIKAWCDPIIDPDSPEEANLFFPGRLTKDYVRGQKKLMSPSRFACFYENRPRGLDEQIFLPEYFQVIPDHEIPHSVWTYMLTDFAFTADDKKTKKTTPDRTAIWIASIDCNRLVYVRDFVVGRWKPDDSVNLACRLWDKYQHLNMKGILIEATTHKELLSSLFRVITRETHIRPKIIPVEGRSQEIKDLRIDAVEPKFKRGEVYFAQSFRNNWPMWRAMFEEMTEWPLSEHDDIPDAISDIDKQDKDGKFYCANPPVGWRSQVPNRFQPSMINGKFNPNFGYPADKMVRAEQLMQENDIWAESSSKMDSKSAGSRDKSIWKQRQRVPQQFGKF